MLQISFKLNRSHGLVLAAILTFTILTIPQADASERGPAKEEGAPARKERGPVYFSVNIEPEKWQALEVKNLPAQVELSVSITTDGSITAALVNSEDLKRFPRINNPLFMGTLDKKLDFSVTTPAPDHYYVVMHNNSTSTTRKVKLVVRAALLRQAPTMAL